MALGSGVLVAGNVLLNSRRRLAVIGSSLLGAAIGAVSYPLTLCSLMGIAAARSVPQGHSWIRFRLAFTTYAQSALGESIPRGALLGLFVAVSWGFWRRARAHRRRDPSPDVTRVA